MQRKVFISIVSGIVIFIITWVYINQYYTLGLEDALFKKITTLRQKILNTKPPKSKEFIFINTAKDLSLVDDTAAYGNIAISDRSKIVAFLRAINHASSKPIITLLDLQFYYPFSTDPSIDDSLQMEVNQLKDVMVSVLYKDHQIDTPLVRTNYGISDYITYGSSLNKFRLYYDGIKAPSIPSLLYEKVDKALFTGNRYMTFCNGKLCFNYLWPTYYYDQENIKKDAPIYNIGSILLSIKNDSNRINEFIKNKIICIGNFTDDIVATPRGKIPGTIILADIYLTLLNNKHMVPYSWMAFLVVSFSFLSYISIYKKIPEIKLKFGFLFSKHLANFISNYISYVGTLMLISLLSFFLFEINISLFLPAFIFSGIEYFVQKKYNPD